MPEEDARTLRSVHRELIRRNVDTSQLDIRIIHGVCYMRGEVHRLRTHPEVDLEMETELIRRLVRAQPGVRDLVWEVKAAA
jgi:hypothetical protein